MAQVSMDEYISGALTLGDSQRKVEALYTMKQSIKKESIEVGTFRRSQELDSDARRTSESDLSFSH